MKQLLLLLALFVCAVTIASPAVSAAQDAGFEAPAKPKSYIVFDAEPQTVPAGKKTTVDLHFKVLEGFHVNSHTPKSELLIPTKLTLETADGVKTEALVYPAGTPYSFSFDPNEKLDVYTGSFTVKLPLVASAGEHKLAGTLHYQACDHAACYPPKNLPVQVLFVAK